MNTTYLMRTMIVPDALVATVRQLADSFGPAASGMWVTPCSASGNLPATHWISSGGIGEEFAAVLPLTTVTQPTELDAAPVITVTPANTDAFLALCASMGVTDPPAIAQLQAIFAAVDVSEQDPYVAMARLGIKLIEDRGTA